MIETPPACIIETERLFFLYDTGETSSFIPIFLHYVQEGKDFRWIAVGSSKATVDKYPEIQSRRLDLKDFGVQEEIEPGVWARDQLLSQASLETLAAHIGRVGVLVVGTASDVQRQMLETFKNAVGIAFIDNFDYNPKNPVVDRVQAAADLVLCPSKHTCELFASPHNLSKYRIVGKPTLEMWMKQVQKVEAAKGEKPIVVLMRGYDNAGQTTYEKLVNPLYSACQKKLTDYQTFVQPHPYFSKTQPQMMSTPEAIAIASYVVGYNSSTVFDARLIGKKAVYLIPEGAKFTHFAIEKGYIPVAHDCDELAYQLKQLESAPLPDLFEKENIPRNSIEVIEEIIDGAVVLTQAVIPQGV